MSRLLARAYHWLSWRSGHALREIRALRAPRVLTYHGVGPQDTPPEHFDWQLRMLRDEFEVVSAPELVDRLIEGRIGGDEVCLTFDDGVRNHYTQAWPLLAEHRIPATFFVCPGLVDSGKWIILWLSLAIIPLSGNALPLTEVLLLRDKPLLGIIV